MGRILAIDYGSKRVGVAVSDPMRMIATGLTTVHSKDILTFLDGYCTKEEVDVIVVGEPTQMDGSPSETAQMIDAFVVHLQRRFKEKTIARMDERFTSKMAMQSLIAGGVKKKDRQNKALIDEVSATIILQSYMEQNA